MAKDKDGDSMSDESKGYLEDVKKGKPRKFAMICKGTSIVSLVVYKKGGIEKRKKEAKESGRGQFYFGTVAGKGIDIRFVLARADGFESSPVKSTVLKSFLADTADIKCKPTFEIVDEPPLVLDEEDPLAARFIQLQPAAQSACEQHPDQAAAINALCREIGTHLDQERVQEASGKLQELEQILTSLGTGADNNPPVAPPTAPPPPPPTAQTQTPPDQSGDSDPMRDKLQQALNKLVPQLKQAVVSYPDKKIELLTPVAQIKKDLEAGAYDAAKQGILAVGALLKQVVAGGGGTPASPNASDAPDLSGVYQSKLAELQPRYDLALQRNAGDTGKFRAVMAYITEQAQAGLFPNAIKGIERLTPAVEQALAAAEDSQWDALLQELTPKLKQVLTEKKGDLKTISELFKRAKATQPADEPQAVELLKQCAALVETALGLGAADSSDSTSSEQQSWQELASEFAGQRSRVAAHLPDQLAEFDRLVQQSSGLAEQGQYAQAIGLAMQIAELDVLARQAATASDVQELIPEHIVEERKTFLLSRWQQALEAARLEVQKLAAPIAEQVPDEDATELVQAINDGLEDFVDELNNAILGAQAAQASDLRPLELARQAIQSYRGKVASDPLLAHLAQAKSDLGVDLKVTESLLSALDDLETRLAG